MKRVLLKLSGEALAGDKKTGFDEATCIKVAEQVKKLTEDGIQVAIVTGGGNFWRGRTSETIDRTKADQIGMLATVMNCIYVSDIFRYAGMKTEVFTPFVCGAFTTLFSKDAAVEALLKDDLDFAYIHLEAPDEMGHQGSFERKVQAIENLDKRIIKRVTEQLEAAGTDFRMLVLPDHPTPVAIRTHVSDPVPYMLYDSTNKQSHTWNYNEKEAQESGNYIDKGYTIINHLFEK